MTSESENILSDAELIRGYLAGDLESFEVLYRRYKERLYAYLNHLLEQKKSAVDDVFQMTWLKAIEHFPSYRDQNMFLAWLMRIAHNLAMDHCRKSSRVSGYELSLSSGKEGHTAGEGNEEEFALPDRRYVPGKNLEQRELAKAVEKAVSSLPPDLREVFLLRNEEIPFKEIALIQKCSINTVLARMQYAVKNLRKILEEWKDDFL